jgi:hypothetical protein
MAKEQRVFRRPLLVVLYGAESRIQRFIEWIEYFELRPGRSFACLDCRADTRELGEYYMVWDDVWNSAGLDVNAGMLCIACLEHRIGRRLNVHDFTDAPINFERIGPRLRDRVFGTVPNNEPQCRAFKTSTDGAGSDPADRRR